MFPYNCRPILNLISLDPLFYNSGDPEFINIFGRLIITNTIKCDGFKFSYSVKIIA